MSKITDVFNAFLGVCDTTLGGKTPPYTEMANPYISEENPLNLYDKAYGIQIGPADNAKRLTKPKLSTDRSLILTMIQRLNFSETDNEGLRSQQLEMTEDLFDLIAAGCDDATLQAAVADFSYENDTGIEFVDGGEVKFYLLEVNFLFKYFDDLP